MWNENLIRKTTIYAKTALYKDRPGGGKLKGPLLKGGLSHSILLFTAI
jgi:hypothetical protein